MIAIRLYYNIDHRHGPVLTNPRIRYYVYKGKIEGSLV